MRFYKQQECEDWLSGHHRYKPEVVPGVIRERIAYPPTPGRIRFLSHGMATSLPYQMPALLWITEWGIWSSSENWHLYYRLRQSYFFSHDEYFDFFAATESNLSDVRETFRS